MTTLTPDEVQAIVEHGLGLEAQLVFAAGKHLMSHGYTALYQVGTTTEFVWAYAVGTGAAMHRFDSQDIAYSFYARCTGSEGELKRFHDEMAEANSATLAAWKEANAIDPRDAEIARLKAELRISRAKSRREKALRKAAEGERDTARRELRDYVAQNPNF